MILLNSIQQTYISVKQLSIDTRTFFLVERYVKIEAQDAWRRVADAVIRAQQGRITKDHGARALLQVVIASAHLQIQHAAAN